MSLLLAILFLSFVVGAIVRGHFSYSNVEYSFKEHPLQYIIVLLFITALFLLCLYLWLREMGFVK